MRGIDGARRLGRPAIVIITSSVRREIAEGIRNIFPIFGARFVSALPYDRVEWVKVKQIIAVVACSFRFLQLLQLDLDFDLNGLSEES